MSKWPIFRRRIGGSVWPSKELVDDRSQGVQLRTLHEPARYWATDYDFGRVETRLNALPQFTTEIDGLGIHFIQVKSRHESALPLVITHGRPGSVMELLDVIGPLTDPHSAWRARRGRIRCCLAVTSSTTSRCTG